MLSASAIFRFEIIHSRCEKNVLSYTCTRSHYKLLLTSYFVKYFRVPSLSERTNRLLRNCPLSLPLFINMPSLVPAGNQQRAFIIMTVFVHTHVHAFAQAHVCECAHLPSSYVKFSLGSENSFLSYFALIHCSLNTLIHTNR